MPNNDWNSLAQLTDTYTSPPDTGLPVEQPYANAITIRPVMDNVAAQPETIDTRPEPMPVIPANPRDFSPDTSSVGSSIDRVINRLTGSNGEERYQTWPEKVVREALAAPHDVMTGQIPQYAIDPTTGDVQTSPQMIEGAQAISALAGTGGVAGTGEAVAGEAALGATPFLRPALKYGDKIYKAPVNGQHLDALPAHLAQDFQTKALNGEDINHYNFGFMNHKGQFLDREKALDYAVKEGLVDPSAGQYGALTSTLLADSSKPGTAIEAMAKAKQYPLAKPTDRWSNTLGQNDGLIQHMTPDEFLNKSRPLKVDAESRENIDALKQHMQEGKPLDPLELNANGKEDGRHRAIAAKELGIKQVPVLNFRPKEPFYSALEHNVNNISQAKMTGDQWLGTLANKPGVKPEELQWTGVQDFLKERGNQPVTKAELQEHLANNKVELKEISKGADGGIHPDEALKVIAKGEDVYFKSPKNPQEARGPLDAEDIAAMRDQPGFTFHTADTGQDTKYHSYQLPGGENYREMLMTLPTQPMMSPEARMLSGLSTTSKVKTLEDAQNARLHNQQFAATVEGMTNEQVLKYAKEVQDFDKGVKQTYRSSHWDEPNILAHVRMNDRVIDGKKSLHLEEIQSDWHQQGRDKGYKGSVNPEELKLIDKEVDDAKRNLVEYFNKQKMSPEEISGALNNIYTRGQSSFVGPSGETLAKAYSDATTKYHKAHDLDNKTVPDAPFKKTWHELALKRMIREAAEKGYDRLSWTPGEAQAARYDLSKSVDRLAYNPETGHLQGYKDKRMVMDQGNVAKDKLPDFIGKEAADKILNKPTAKVGINGAYHELSDADLKVGGEGMKGFYDQIIPKALSKISGERVKTVNLTDAPKYEMKNPLRNKDGKEIYSVYKDGAFMADMEKSEAEHYIEAKKKTDRPATAHYIDIPQSLKDQAMHKGFPLFANGYIYTPVAHDPFKNEKKK